MNEANTNQSTEFVWRRLTEPVRLFNHDLDPRLWLLILVLVLGTAFFYVGWMYIRDSRSIGPVWASLLALLRSAVYAILAVVFLLPAEQTWEESRRQSKVELLFDTSLSMLNTIDDIPTGSAGEKLLSRQEKVVDFLRDEKIAFLPGLLQKNPVTAYRFGTKLTDDPLYLTADRHWTKEERDLYDRPPLNEDGSPGPLPEARPLPPEYWAAWLRPTFKPEVPDDWNEGQKARLEKLTRLNEDLLKKGVFAGTNLGDSTLAAVSHELNNMVQGVVVFTDGRSTEGSAQAFADLAQRTRSAHIPLFVVAVGEERPQVKVRIEGVRLPRQVQPEDKFRAVVEVTGEGLPEKPADVTLEITHTRKVQAKQGGKKEEELPITLIEAEDKSNPNQKRVVIDLGKKLTLKPPVPVAFDKGNPPRAEVEFPLDAAALAEAAGVKLTEGDYARKKWELGETKDGELKVQAVIPRHKLEIFAGKQHVSEVQELVVLKRPMRVLLFASAPMRDYQFLRTLLVREMEKKRVDLTIHLQLPPGSTERRVGVVQDVPPERLLADFPNRLDQPGPPEEKQYDLKEYDVIVAFDPDWTQLSAKQLSLLAHWVERGGGLVVIGGPINTLQLARPGAYKEKVRPIQDLYPVVLSDVRIDELERSTSDPWPLNFQGATPEMEFLKLEEDENTPFLADWRSFFYGKEPKSGSPPERGFYNYYPVVSAKAGTLVAARFTDPKARLKDGSQQPYIVLTDPAGSRRVIWIGSGETWRLRQYREAYHERFWTKLIRYAGAKSQGRSAPRIRLDVERTVVANQFIDIRAQIDAEGGEPLPADAKPEVLLKLPPGVPAREIPTRYTLTSVPGRPGLFATRFQVRSPGDYSFELKVPRSSDTETGRFSVKEANPELDNTRPDFEQMYQLASEADEVLARLGSDAERQELKRSLRRPARMESTTTERADLKEEKPRLYFDLKNARLIPSCMKTVENTQRSRGPIENLWDVWQTLAAVVGLLSLEWLIRKLLRLA